MGLSCSRLVLFLAGPGDFRSRVMFVRRRWSLWLSLGRSRGSRRHQRLWLLGRDRCWTSTPALLVAVADGPGAAGDGLPRRPRVVGRPRGRQRRIRGFRVGLPQQPAGHRAARGPRTYCAHRGGPTAHRGSGTRGGHRPRTPGYQRLRASSPQALDVGWPTPAGGPVVCGRSAAERVDVEAAGLAVRTQVALVPGTLRLPREQA
jgi:hypothetical protein